MKSPLENFKYLFKFDDIKKSTISMVYQLLKATKNKNLFWAKNIKRAKITKELSESRFNDTKEANVIQRFHYNNKAKNWIDPDTGEYLITDKKIKNLKSQFIEKKNLKELQVFFANKITK
ncbi:hypothetical protein LJE86_18425 [bacterium BMS3Abin03]|nr:hypothetical protein [bacterium BMS3Abin03]MCG6961214.1 hypothetical protein [bacterium BMS3Abin03]